MPDNLSQLLAGRLLNQPQATGPDPNQPQGTGDEDWLQKGISLVRGAVPFGGGPDNSWNRAGQLLSASAPLIGSAESVPELVQTMLKYKTHPVADATGTLLNLLNSYKAEAVPSSVGLGYTTTGRYMPPALHNETVFNRLKTRVPEVDGLLDYTNGRIARPYGFNAERDRQNAIRASLKAAKSTPEVQVASSPEDLANITQKPVQKPVPKLTGRDPNARITRNMSDLKRAGLTIEQIQQIRKMSPAEAQKLFPNKKIETIRGIISGDSFGWVK